MQAGWDPQGYFAPGTAELRLEGSFELTDESLLRIRADHTEKWLAQKRTDGEQVGITSFMAVRVSDDPDDEKTGRAHRLQLVSHTFRYFDYLATHDMLRECTDAESAKDFLAESSGVRFHPVATREQCLGLLELMREQRSEWAPEAVFSTLRSLLILSAADDIRRLRPADLAQVFSR